MLLLFSEQSADCILHKSPPKYHSLRKSGFGLAGKFYFRRYLWNI